MKTESEPMHEINHLLIEFAGFIQKYFVPEKGKWAWQYSDSNLNRWDDLFTTKQVLEIFASKEKRNYYKLI